MRSTQVYQDFPTGEHWQNLEAFKSRLITPQEFESRWDVSRQELAQICEVNIRTVKRWFQNPDTAGYSEPTFQQLILLTLTNEIWMQTSQQRRLRRLAA